MFHEPEAIERAHFGSALGLGDGVDELVLLDQPVKFPILCGVFCVFGRAHLAILELLGVLKMWVRAVCARLDGNVVVDVVEALTY